MNNCKNCETELRGQFCEACGQRMNKGRIFFSDLFDEAFNRLVSLDTPLARTIKTAFLKPGVLAHEYVSGRRIAFYPPIKFYLFSFAIVLIVKTLFDFDPVENQMRLSGQSAPPPGQPHISVRAGQFASEHMNFFTIFLILIFSACSRLFYWPRKFNYTEHFTFALFVVSLYVLVTAFLIPLSAIHPALYYLYIFMILVHMPMALMQFNQKSGVLQAVQALVLSLVSYVVFIAVVFACIFFYLAVLSGTL